MDKIEKQLLFKDLCARLPYGVMCDRLGHPKKLLGVHPNKKYPLEFDRGEYMPTEYMVEDVKPYLRPMSSMTPDERKEYDKLIANCLYDAEAYFFENYNRLYDWLLEYHFDFRNLIEKGLALEAPEDMYKTE